jgi:hypothetical protein
MKRAFLFLCSVLILRCAFAEVIEVPFGNEVTQTISWSQPNAVATLIYLPGGDGSFNIASRNPQQPNWVLLGLYESSPPINAVFFDSPYGLGWKNGDLAPRHTKDHLGRVLSVVEYYRKLTNKPIFLMGHSNGAVSVAEFLNQDPKNQTLLKGAILSGGRNETDIDVKLNLPILVVHHQEDTNKWTQPQSAQNLFEKLKKENSAPTELVYVTGGQDGGGPAETSGHHMYAGAVDEASEILKKFILKNLK